MIPLAYIAAFLPPENSKIFHAGDVVALYGDVTHREKYAVIERQADKALIRPLGKFGECGWWGMVGLHYAGFMA